MKKVVFFDMFLQSISNLSWKQILRKTCFISLEKMDPGMSWKDISHVDFRFQCLHKHMQISPVKGI